MTPDFFKFPATPHLFTMSGVDVRSDKVMTEVERMNFLLHDLVVEEKVDGANLGISFDSEGSILMQNRGDYLYPPMLGQWKKLEEWLTPRAGLLFEHLQDRYILFGEWCYARHFVFYEHLPDWFLGFDIYDRQAGRFFATTRRDEMLNKLGVIRVPEITRGRFSHLELLELLSKSRLADRLAEGVYLRYDKGDWLEQRAKLVRPEFLGAIGEHWSRSGITPNRLGAHAYIESSQRVEELTLE